MRVVFNFQLAAVFTADVTLYMLRKLQRQVSVCGEREGEGLDRGLSQ